MACLVYVPPRVHEHVNYLTLRYPVFRMLGETVTVRSSFHPPTFSVCIRTNASSNI